MSAQVLTFPLTARQHEERPHLVLVPPLPSEPTYRLTQRGRAVVAFLVAAALALLGLALSGQLASAADAPTSVTVQYGQTLSGIAARELPELPIRDGVVELQLANRLSTSQIHAGQVLIIPAH